MRVTLVHNPGAGDERHTADKLLKELKKAGYDPRLLSTRKESDVGDFEAPGDFVIVAGGDGSIKRAVISLAGRGVPVAILPIGTANNIAKSFGALGSVPELIAGWRDAERRLLTIGRVATRWGSMRFVESVGVGVFTELMSRGAEEVDESSTGLTGHALDRALLLLRQIVAERPAQERRLEIDGKDLSGDYLLVEVMNMPLVGPNVPLAPLADTRDDQLDVVLVAEKDREALAEYVRSRLTGGGAPPKLTVRRGARVVMRASPSELHVDDDKWRPTRRHGVEGPEPTMEEGEVTMTLEDAGVEVLVPSKPASASAS